MPKKIKDKNFIYLIKLSTLNDLARYVNNFDFTYDSLFFDKKLNCIFAFGEKISDNILVYYLTLNNKKNFLKYTPATEEEKEKTEFIENIDSSFTNTSYINTINMEIPLKKGKNDFSKNTQMIKLENSADLIKIAISKSGNDNSNNTCLYSFNISNKKAIIFGIDLISTLENHKNFIYFAEEDYEKIKNFGVFSYRENKTGFVDYIGEHSYSYIKIIKLAEKPLFIKQ